MAKRFDTSPLPGRSAARTATWTPQDPRSFSDSSALIAAHPEQIVVPRIAGEGGGGPLAPYAVETTDDLHLAFRFSNVENCFRAPRGGNIYVSSRHWSYTGVELVSKMDSKSVLEGCSAPPLTGQDYEKMTRQLLLKLDTRYVQQSYRL